MIWCDPTSRVITYSYPLAKRIRCYLSNRQVQYPVQYPEYIIAHELVHLLERHHNDRFRKLMHNFVLQWRLNREELNRVPLGYED